MSNFSPDRKVMAWFNAPQRQLYMHIGENFKGKSMGTISSSKRFVYNDESIVIFYSLRIGIGSHYYPLFIRTNKSPGVNLGKSMFDKYQSKYSHPKLIDNEMSIKEFDKLIKSISV